MANLIKYDPFSDAGFDDLFRGFFQPIRFEGQTQAPSIRMDVSEDDKSYIVHAEMPGVNKNDIQVTIEGNQVTLGAEVKREKEVKDDQRILQTERYYGSTDWSFTLSTEVDEAASEAKYDKGVLELRLAKKAASGQEAQRSVAKPVGGGTAVSRLFVLSSPQRMRFAGYSSSMLSRKKLHGEEAPTKRRHVSALTPSYSNVPAVSSTTSLRLLSS